MFSPKLLLACCLTLALFLDQCECIFLLSLSNFAYQHFPLMNSFRQRLCRSSPLSPTGGTRFWRGWRRGHSPRDLLRRPRLPPAHPQRHPRSAHRRQGLPFRTDAANHRIRHHNSQQCHGRPSRKFEDEDQRGGEGAAEGGPRNGAIRSAALVDVFKR